MTNKKDLNRYLTEFAMRKPIRKFTNGKVYNRAKDRKDKRLYEIDSEEEVNGVTEER